MVSDALVEEVRARADLVEICGEHTTLRRVGKSYRGPCPLHGGEGPNFSVDPARGIFKCFVCGEGGDVFAFVMKKLGLEFPDAVRHVASRTGIEVPVREEAREDPYAHLREVAAFAREWFCQQLRSPAGAAARRHLQERGIGPEAAERYGLGFAPDGWRELRAAALARGIPEANLLALGLLATSERSEEPYDRFRNRLIFTIFDLRDRPIGFGGRWIGPASREVPKYINSPDSPIFHKGETLYGLNWARHAIRREGYAAVMEGYTDVLAAHLRGLPLAVAGLGTAFTPRQAKTLARYAKRAYLLYDSDAAGLRATFRTADVLLAAGVHPLVVTLPRGEDPDSLLRRQGTEALRACLEEALDVLEKKLQILEGLGLLEGAEGRRRAVDKLLTTLRAVRDPALRDIYIDRISRRTGVRRETLLREAAGGGGGGSSSGVGGPHRGGRRMPEAPARERRPAAERTLLLLLLRDVTRPRGEREASLVGRAVGSGLEPAHFRDPEYREIYEGLVAADRAGGEGWQRSLRAELLPLAEELLEDETELTHPVEIFDESVRRLLHGPRLRRLAEIDRELELADEERARALLLEKQGIAAELREAGLPLSFLRRLEDA